MNRLISASAVPIALLITGLVACTGGTSTTQSTGDAGTPAGDGGASPGPGGQCEAVCSEHLDLHFLVDVATSELSGSRITVCFGNDCATGRMPDKWAADTPSIITFDPDAQGGSRWSGTALGRSAARAPTTAITLYRSLSRTETIDGTIVTVRFEHEDGGAPLAEETFEAAFVEDTICGLTCRVFRVGTGDD